jgi:hypothetical protein
MVSVIKNGSCMSARRKSLDLANFRYVRKMFEVS